MQHFAARGPPPPPPGIPPPPPPGTPPAPFSRYRSRSGSIRSPFSESGSPAGAYRPDPVPAVPWSPRSRNRASPDNPHCPSARRPDESRNPRRHSGYGNRAPSRLHNRRAPPPPPSRRPVRAGRRSKCRLHRHRSKEHSSSPLFHSRHSKPSSYRAPKIRLPTRTNVEPCRAAISKSPLIPIDRIGS